MKYNLGSIYNTYIIYTHYTNYPNYDNFRLLLSRVIFTCRSPVNGG